MLNLYGKICFFVAVLVTMNTKVYAEENSGSVLAIAQNQLAWMGVAVAILTVILTLFSLIGLAAPFVAHYLAKKWHKELKEEFQDNLSKHENKLDELAQKHGDEAREKIEQQSSCHEERFYAVEIVLLRMWGTRSEIISQSQEQPSAELSNTFLRQFNDHLRDSITLRQLLLNVPSEVADALGKLESKVEILPATEMLALLDLLERQGRLDAQLCQEPAKRLREKLAGNSEQTS